MNIDVDSIRERYTLKDVKDCIDWVSENFSIEPEFSSKDNLVYYRNGEIGFGEYETFTTDQLVKLWEKYKNNI